eukprot:jgi/Phyca11/132445/e_gw1.167.10.1
MATKRNECLHVDYLFLGDSYGDARYVLVLKDELSHYTELVACDSPTSLVASRAILDWHKRFGLPETWISDNGSHFKNELLRELATLLKATHRFVPVYTPWINGTVERVNRDLLQVLRANLNHTPARSLGGHAPIELFTGLPPSSPLDRRRRLQEMAKQKGQLCNFEVGDFVLWSRIDKRLRGNKLLVRWVGPFLVLRALPHSFVVQHLLTGDEYDVHGSRLKFYHDSDLNVTAEIRQHVRNQGIVLDVRDVLQHRFNETTQEWELLVAWRGLQDEENSWEPFESMKRDVPSMVRQYVERAHAAVMEEFL